MKKMLDLIREELEKAFAACGYEEKYAKVTISNRPDLCEYQCNGALAAARQYRKAPMAIAEEVCAAVGDSDMFAEITAAAPGFINMKAGGGFLSRYLNGMAASPKLGCEETKEAETVMIDYGGANVAKPLHVGHLRSAIIGESIKRLLRFKGHTVTGDVHLGDWGLQMGLIIAELKERQPELVYFDGTYEGEYPEAAPFTISELEEIYPFANAKSKEDEAFKEEAKTATFELQNGRRGYLALWHHILNVSMADLKRNYDNLNVTFDLWKKESDAQPYIPDMVQYLKEEGYAHISQGALVVDVAEETDTKEVPPCMILKSDGATLYNTTDLATLVERRKLFDPDHIIYVVDKRQGLYFEQVFRCARKTKLVKDGMKLTFLGFGTMNGRDGKPFKTRDGGVMRLEHLMDEIHEAVYRKMKENREVSEEEARQTAKIIGLAALKYGDLSNQAVKDYVFDIDRFTSFEGNTGPYIQYTIVRIKSIQKKYNERKEAEPGPEGAGAGNGTILPASTDCERALQLQLSKFIEMVDTAYEEIAPHRICQYLYELSDAFNRFYHETRILAEEDRVRRASYLALLRLTKEALVLGIDLLGFEAPERM
ncbi:MAG: arginine--tRNA ligase [Lachnospiraceae bacterium]|nr:arginine--tRNA ligase [Lachnospiraceae bacterium]